MTQGQSTTGATGSTARTKTKSHKPSEQPAPGTPNSAAAEPSPLPH
jgi:hypothetical protein